MSKTLHFMLNVAVLGIAIMFSTIRCGNDREGSFGVASPDNCFGCHLNTSETGRLIESAIATYDESVHKNGVHAELWAPTLTRYDTISVKTLATGDYKITINGITSTYAAAVPADTEQVILAALKTAIEAQAPVLPVAVSAVSGTGAAAEMTISASANAIFTMSVTTNLYDFSDSPFKVIGYEWEGSDAYYANATGCQVCHTSEGFIKKKNNEYADVAAQDADLIQKPAPIGCWTCHAPHTTGDFSLTVANGTQVALQTGAVWSKSKGSVCVSCHQMRLKGSDSIYYSSSNQKILADVKAAYLSSGVYKYGVNSSSWGPHHGPQSDMILGKGGAEYSGRSYTNSSHATADGADCTTCHMAMPSTSGSTAGLSPNVGNHSFNVQGIVHAAQKINIAGCDGCHTNVAAKTAATSGTTALLKGGLLLAGDAYVSKPSTAGQEQAATQVAKKINDALVRLANPDNTISGEGACWGLMAAVFKKLTGTCNGPSGGNCPGAIPNGSPYSNPTLKWTALADGTTNKRCKSNGFNTYTGVYNASAADTSNETRAVKALWNYKFVYEEDKSFGNHNTQYALQLLYDSCADLFDLATNTLGITSINGVTLTDVQTYCGSDPRTRRRH